MCGLMMWDISDKEWNGWIRAFRALLTFYILGAAAWETVRDSDLGIRIEHKFMLGDWFDVILLSRSTV